MSADDYAQLLADEGLKGWKAAVRYASGWIAVLTPPGFGRDGCTAGMVTRRGRDQADALTNAILYVKGSRQ